MKDEHRSTANATEIKLNRRTKKYTLKASKETMIFCKN